MTTWAYDGNVIPVEEYHLMDRRGTLCGIDTLPIKWRFTEQHPLTGVLCRECVEATEGMARDV